MAQFEKKKKNARDSKVKVDPKLAGYKTPVFVNINVHAFLFTFGAISEISERPCKFQLREKITSIQQVINL